MILAVNGYVVAGIVAAVVVVAVTLWGTWPGPGL